MYVLTPGLVLKVKVDDGKIVFSPPFAEVRDMVLAAFREIVISADGLPRVICLLFSCFEYFFKLPTTFIYFPIRCSWKVQRL